MPFVPRPPKTPPPAGRLKIPAGKPGSEGGVPTIRDNLGHETLAQFQSGAVRSSDADKIRWDLMPWAALREVARVFTWGAKKYADRNWEKGIPKGRMFGSAMRHYIDSWLGEDFDREAGINHLAHAAWNVLCDLEFVLRGRKDLDDRPREGMVLAPTVQTAQVAAEWRRLAQEELARLDAQPLSDAGAERLLAALKPRRTAKGKRRPKRLRR